MLPSRNDHLAKAKRNRDFANKLPKKGSNLYGLSSRSSLLFRPTLRQRVRCGIQYEIRKSQARQQELASNQVLSPIYNDYRICMITDSTRVTRCEITIARTSEKQRNRSSE